MPSPYYRTSARARAAINSVLDQPNTDRSMTVAQIVHDLSQPGVSNDDRRSLQRRLETLLEAMHQQAHRQARQTAAKAVAPVRKVA